MVNYLRKNFTLEYLYQIIVIFKKKIGSKSNFDNDFTNGIFTHNKLCELIFLFLVVIYFFFFKI